MMRKNFSSYVPQCMCYLATIYIIGTVVAVPTVVEPEVLRFDSHSSWALHCFSFLLCNF